MAEKENRMTDDTPKSEHSPNAEFLAWLAREHPEIKGADAMISAGVRLAAEAFKAGRGLP